MPTLIRQKSSQLAYKERFHTDPNLRYVPPDVLEKWQDITADYGATLSELLRNPHELQRRVVKLMSCVGVAMLAGSDATQNLHKIDGVVRAGHYYSAQDLAAILANVELRDRRWLR